MMTTDHSDRPNGTEDDAASRSRTRVSRACTRCRARKDKCDGVHPSCATCLSADVVCSYEASTKKRGLPEGYVRGLEKLWTVLIHRIDGIEDVVAQVFNDDRDSLLQLWNQKDSGEALHSLWKESRILQELEAFLSSVDAIAAPGTKRKRDSNEENIGADPDIQSDLNRVLTVAYTVHRSSADPANRIMGPAVIATNSEVPQRLRFPTEVSKILDHYFRFTHCWLPILDRPYFLRRSYEFTRSETLVSSENADLAVLAAAIAYASETSQSPLPCPWTGAPSWDILAWKCIPPVAEDVQIGHVQAVVMLALGKVGRGEWDGAWTAVGFAIRALQGIVRRSTSRINAVTATRQACLILETALALNLDHDTHLRGEDIMAESLLSEDGHEEWETWNAPDVVNFYSGEPAFIISCFNNVTRVFATINDHTRNQGRQRSDSSSGRGDEAVLSLNTLAQTHSYSALLDETTRRPPHQEWLKVIHLLAACLVSPEQPQQPLFVLKQLNIVSETLQTWIDCSALGLKVMPPFVFGLLQATFDKVLPGAGHQSSALPLANFVDQLGRSGASWPIAQDLAMRLRGQLEESTRTRPSQPSLQTHTTKRPRLQQYPFDAQQTQHGSLNLWPADPFSQPQISQSSMQQASRRSIDGYNSYGTHNPSVDIMTGGSSDGHNSALIAASPSFQGDEIDALFREMAQLDATEWTSGRTQGLKDFGFSDDMTFEAFCNDPDRLYSNGNNNITIPGQELAIPPTLLYTGQGSSGVNAFDVMDSSWNG